MFGRGAGLIPLKAYCAKACVDLVAWDLRNPGKELGRALGRLLRERGHTREVKMLATRARRDGVQGIAYRSVRDPKRWCVVVFCENVGPAQFRRCTWKAMR